MHPFYESTEYKKFVFVGKRMKEKNTCNNSIKFQALFLWCIRLATQKHNSFGYSKEKGWEWANEYIGNWAEADKQDQIAYWTARQYRLNKCRQKRAENERKFNSAFNTSLPEQLGQLFSI